ncbi:37S ribosomal protein S17 mitochondrial [Cichlidogyrus casuarinus]|uniref:37S ribosomal protein S17 mitochondrial n=1 Tax=Cichlidogyrus casuarinus TaxID=1844966 RepID=A0ABD2PXH6_9PLAT
MVRYVRHKSERIINNTKPYIQKYFPYQKPEFVGVSPPNANLSGRMPKTPFNLAIGEVVPFGQNLHGDNEDIVKVRMQKLVLNSFLLKYFYQSGTFWAHRQGLDLKIGDIVLLKKTPKPIAFNTLFKVQKLIYSIGQMVDPVTGLPCEGEHFPTDTLAKLLHTTSKS